MQGENGRAIPNQFIMVEEGHGANGNFISKTIFQSYESIIAIITIWDKKDCTLPHQKTRDIQLDKTYWDYSKTTSKYRNRFLGEDTKTTRAKIKSGEYILTNLN